MLLLLVPVLRTQATKVKAWRLSTEEPALTTTLSVLLLVKINAITKIESYQQTLN